MNLKDVIFTDNLPSIDLHGYDRDYARIKVLEFITDNITMKNEIIVIIHGIGEGIIKGEVYKTLNKNKHVVDYRLFYLNSGITLVKLDIDKK